MAQRDTIEKNFLKQSISFLYLFYETCDKSTQGQGKSV